MMLFQLYPLYCMYLQSVDFFSYHHVKNSHLDAFALCGGDLSRSSVPAKSFLPIPSNCLCIKRTSGHPSKGGFFEKFIKVYKIVINPISGDIHTKTVIHAHHMPDSKTVIVPDMYAKLPCYLYPDPAQDYAAAKQFYLKMLEDAPSNCSGCCQYVKHSYYRFPKICFPLALIIDSSTIEDHQQIVIPHAVVHKLDLNHVDDQCTIQIQRVSDSPQWERIQEFGLQIGTQLQNKEENVHPTYEEPLTENECIQAGLPYRFDGGMYAFGKHVYNYGKEKPYVEYCGTHWFQPHIRMLTELLQSSEGGVLLVIL